MHNHKRLHPWRLSFEVHWTSMHDVHRNLAQSANSDWYLKNFGKMKATKLQLCEEFGIVRTLGKEKR